MLRRTMPLNVVSFIALLLILAISPIVASAQGLLVNVNSSESVTLPRPRIWPPRPPHIRPPMPNPSPERMSSYKIKSLEVNTTLKEQIAKVNVSQTFVNTGSTQMEVSFMFPLPYDGAIDQLTLLVDGKEFAAKLLDASAARSQYESIVRKNKDPALLEWVGNGMFQTSVFPIPPGQERKVTLRYSQLCRKHDGMTDFLFPLATAKYTAAPVEEIKFHLAIESNSEIKNVYSPTHSVDIKRPDDKHASVDYVGKNTIPSGDFRLLYDVGAGQVNASAISYRSRTSEDGYVLLLASPQIKADSADRPKKTVVFVVDKSGSMSGKKIEQAKSALKFVLENLREGDTFNIVAYDDKVESWKPELQKYNEENRKAAIGYVEGIYAGGSTNIDGALTSALSQIQDSTRPNYVIFLTDGLPTAGETNEQKIVVNAKSNNKIHARIFAFGVGYDLNSRLLDKIVRENSGESEYVRPDEDIEAHVATLYKQIAAPVLSDVKIKFDLDGHKTEDGPIVNRQYPKEVKDIFAGQQLVIVGRYKKSGAAKVTVTGRIGDKEQSFDFPMNLVDKSSDDSNGYVEKLWAIRRVGEIMDEIDLKTPVADSHSYNTAMASQEVAARKSRDELIKELVALSIQHGIITPYTSFLADENSNFRDVAANTERARNSLDSLGIADGRSGVEQRMFKNSLQKSDQAPLAAADLFDAEAAQNIAGTQLASSGKSGDSSSRSSGPASGVGGQGQQKYAEKFSRIEAIQANNGPNSTNGLVPATSTPQPAFDSDKSKELAQNEKSHVSENVLIVGQKTFYRRNNNLVDSAASEDQEKKPIKIERYSKEYFALIDKHGKEIAKYLAIEEPVILVLDGKAYQF